MSTPAIFLSYAREDAASARRIAEALRAAGLEVWFDENELRGGDAWDAKIRRQIRECTLFLPVISAQTQARHEGYFRREWKLAVDRLSDMAGGIAFLVPVVIDDTREAEALVPEEFMRVQWTRLPGALPTPQFVEQVKRLLATPRQTVGRGHRTPPESSEATAAAASNKAGFGDPALQSRPNRLPLVLGAVAVLALVAVAGYFLTSRGSNESKNVAAVADPGPAKVAPATPAKAVAAAEKSIAVLPFANMSEDKENAFFTDGVHEDIVTNLALIRDLKVVSRTTVMRYRETKKSLREIGEELGVAYILEGSVRRAGNKVRVTGQLINTRTDEHVWAKSYDRDLTDIFAIQAALAQEIASALEAAISPETQKHLARRPTENPAAYDLFLRGRDIRNRAPTASPEALEQAGKLFQSAVDLDPGFAAAWGELSVVHALKVFWEQDASPERLRLADAADATARRLAPDAPDVIRLSGTFAYYAYRDYARATAAYQQIIKQQPNDPTGYASLALILRRQGRWAEAIEAHRRAVELDPANIAYLRNQLAIYGYVRRWTDARAVQARILVLLPGELREQYLAAVGDNTMTGSTSAMEQFVASLNSEQRESALGRYARRTLAALRGDYAGFRAIDDVTPFFPEYEGAGISQQTTISMHLAHGQPELARRVALQLRANSEKVLVRESANVRSRLALSFALAVLGETDEALRVLAKIDEFLPESRDAIDSTFTRVYRTYVLALAGKKQEAVDELARFLAKPNSYGVNILRADPALNYSLRGFAPYEALLADPKNNAPLF
jgi:TolB-like protein